MRVFLLVLCFVTTLHSQNDSLLIGKGSPKLYGEGYRLLEEVNSAFSKMKEAAAKDGIQLQIVSSYRSYSHQKRIWQNKYKRYTRQGLSPNQAISKIIEYSTIPGTSRHHWGTEVDIIDGSKAVTGDVLVPSKFHGNGPFCELREWLENNAKTYGFFIVYTPDSKRRGFKYEPWHYSYAKLSIPYLKKYLELNLNEVLKQSDLEGSDYFSKSFIKRYKEEHILDINPELLGVTSTLNNQE